MSSPWGWRPARPSLSRQPASLIRLEGDDTLRVLHGQTSADIEGAGCGQWIATCCISATARLRALAEVLVDGRGAWLVVSAGDGALVHQALDRVLFPADRAQLQPPSPGWLITPVPGQQEQLEAGPAGRWLKLDGGGWQLGAGALGLGLVLGESDPMPELWAGRELLDAQEQERWRIQQGRPAVPSEINDDHNPFELGLADRVSLSKGCYVGQETLAKLATYDGVKQQLRRWHWRADGSAAPPTPGQVLQALPASGADGPAAGEAALRLGLITSALELANGDWIGLALVRRRALESGELQAGEGNRAPRLELSLPDGFVMPPAGAGTQRS
ncbi:MAG: folate-binding protein [Cyanobacteria bacterium J06638_7]